MDYLAHVSEDKREQLLYDHLIGTAELAEQNAVRMFKPIAYAVGKSHDIGKYSDLFQQRLKGSKKPFEHSACGAIEYKELLMRSENQVDHIFAAMVEFCIACHHTGLQDGGSLANNENYTADGTLCFRIRDSRKSAEYTGDGDYSRYREEISLDKPDFNELFSLLRQEKDKKSLIELYSFFTRYLFSCLTDADYIDTERFFKPEVKRGYIAGFKTPAKRLEEKLSQLPNNTRLQRTRSRIQQQAYRNAMASSQINILNMPTGSGKTYCSLKLALDKLNTDSTKKRIIYVIPYTGIIDQTAKTFEPIFKDCGGILQHHSNYDFGESTENDSTGSKLKKACENWDAPVIITTAVQFFESICHYKSSALRKLHNMADSVIVFDEIHTLPVDCLQPCLRSIGYITKYLNSEAIFLSATMPDYTRLFEKYAPDCKINHLIKDKSDFAVFKKAEFVNLGKTDFDSIAEKAAQYSTSLIIMNTKNSVREMFKLVTGKKYHLSTYMTPADREITISRIKKDMEKGEKLTVVSTSLIEAGIDLDFETVFREINGLDSILQAGGRCNREGTRDKGTVFIFETDKSNMQNNMKITTTKRLLEKYPDISSAECIEEYYNEIFLFNSNIIDRNSIAERCNNPYEIPFRTFAEGFELIKDESVGVVIPVDQSMTEKLRQLQYCDKDMRRRLQRYTVSLKCRYENSEFCRALSAGVIEQTRAGLFVVADLNYYSSQTGLDIDKANDYFV